MATGVPSHVISASGAAFVPFTCTLPFAILALEIFNADAGEVKANTKIPMIRRVNGGSRWDSMRDR
jgi:hypothetical protein